MTTLHTSTRILIDVHPQSLYQVKKTNDARIQGLDTHLTDRVLGSITDYEHLEAEWRKLTIVPASGGWPTEAEVASFLSDRLKDFNDGSHGFKVRLEVDTEKLGGNSELTCYQLVWDRDQHKWVMRTNQDLVAIDTLAQVVPAVPEKFGTSTKRPVFASFRIVADFGVAAPEPVPTP